MPHLLHLPTEILLSIYHNTSNIDDVLHLARTCRQMHAIFHAPRNRVEIFRSVIKSTPHHKTDHQISYLQDLHSTLETLYGANNNLTMGFLRPSDKIFTHVDSLLTSDKYMSDQFVWDTVARWHGMKVLFFGLYCDESVHASYVNSTPPRAQFKESNRYRDRLAAEDPLAPPAGVTITIDSAAQEKQALWRAYERFYQALTLHWAVIETLCLARAASYTSSTERNARFEHIWTQWTDTARPLKIKIDVLEVVEFVWGYLGRKVFQEKDVIVKWVGGTSVFDEFYDEEEPVGTNWMYFVRCLMRYLRPAHILELLLGVVWKGEGREEIDRVEYLRRVGFFDESAGVVEREDEEESDPDTMFNIGGLQEDVAVGLEAWAEGHEVDVDTEARWEVYRDKLWGAEMRGRVLFREESEEGLFGRITGDREGGGGGRAGRLD